MAVRSDVFHLGYKVASARFLKPVFLPRITASSLSGCYPICRHTAPFDITSKSYSSQDVSSHITQPPSRDFLMQNLKSTTDPKALMEVVNMHHSIMNNKHIMQALRSLFELSKAECFFQDKDAVIKSVEFQKLCKILRQQSRSLEINETIEALKIVSYLGLPTSSSIVQILLQLLRHNVNELSLPNIVFLEFILKKFDNCPLVEALNIALPLVFEIQLSTKLDRDNTAQVAEMLQYAVRQNLSDATLTLLTDCLSGVCHKMDAKMAENTTWVLLNVNRPILSGPFLLRQALNIVSKNIINLSFEEVYKLLSKVVSKYLKSPGNFYHEEFLDSCAAYVIEKQCNLQRACWILKRLTRIGHTNIKLLDYIGELVASDPSALENAEVNTVIILTGGMSSANYRTNHWDTIETGILKNKIMEEDKLQLPWLKFALELTSLGCFHQPLLQRVFDEDFLRKFLNRDYNVLDLLQLLMLFQAVVTLYPSYRGPFPPDDLIQQASTLNGVNVSEFPLKGALEHGLGGASYLQTRLSTKLGHFIDHVIVMRKGGYPVAVNNSQDQEDGKKFVEDLDVPPDSKVILVLGLHRGCYTLNCNRLRGHFSLMCKGLEAMGFSVVPVSLAEWSQMSEHEKIPFLMQSIKLKCDMATSEVSVVQ